MQNLRRTSFITVRNFPFVANICHFSDIKRVMLLVEAVDC